MVCATNVKIKKEHPHRSAPLFRISVTFNDINFLTIEGFPQNIDFFPLNKATMYNAP